MYLYLQRKFCICNCIYYDFLKSNCSSIYYKEKVCNCNCIYYTFFEYRVQLWVCGIPFIKELLYIYSGYQSILRLGDSQI